MKKRKKGAKKLSGERKRKKRVPNSSRKIDDLEEKIEIIAREIRRQSDSRN